MSKATKERTPKRTPQGESARIEALLDRVRSFMESEVHPLEEAARSKGFFELEPTLQEKRRKVKELGLWTPQVPKAWGGLGLSLADFGRVMEVLGRSPYGHYVFNCQAPDAGNIEILHKYGTPEQKERWLEPLLGARSAAASR
jgi:acyl-CoA dehydrogenase